MRCHETRLHRGTEAILPITAQALTLTVDGKTLLGPLDLEIPGPGVTAIMGPNGAGKSLLLRLLHGLIRPSLGNITFAGRALDAATRARQAMVFQKPVLLRRSAAANVEFVLQARGQRRSSIRVQQARQLLDQVGLIHLDRQPARSLSGGEQQRLALARALATEPSVLFMDEPTASLDPVSILAIEALVRSISAAGMKVILVTHDPGQARRLASDVVFMAGGHILEHGLASRFFVAPRSDEARAFVGGDPIVTTHTTHQNEAAT